MWRRKITEKPLVFVVQMQNKFISVTHKTVFNRCVQNSTIPFYFVYCSSIYIYVIGLIFSFFNVKIRRRKCKHRRSWALDQQLSHLTLPSEKCLFSWLLRREISSISFCNLSLFWAFDISPLCKSEFPKSMFDCIPFSSLFNFSW